MKNNINNNNNFINKKKVSNTNTNDPLKIEIPKINNNINSKPIKPNNDKQITNKKPSVTNINKPNTNKNVSKTPNKNDLNF